MRGSHAECGNARHLRGDHSGSWRNLAIGGLTILNLLQLGEDPLTDSLELGLVDADLVGDDAAAAADDDAMASVCGGESFAADTKVLLASGAAISIADLTPGDKVLATNVRTGKTKAIAVSAVMVHHDTNLYDLKIKAGSSTAVIHTTAGHPFWDVTTHRWVKAAALHRGDQLRTPAGRIATVAGGYTPKQDTGWMWDLTIPGDHDFYVDTTASPVLVHNSSCPLTNSQATDMAKRLGYHPTNLFIKGQRVFTNGKNYIVQDIDSHSGGLWKMARSAKGLASKKTRMGTYDYNGNYIGP